jgi:S-adenosylmethionine:tRNA ribosyltransferase-isomerase
MQLSDFDYELPEELIAQAPPAERSDGRLLLLEGAEPQHRKITEIPSLLRAGDLLVMNNTRVYPARLYGQKATGGKVELLVERILDNQRALCLCKASKSPKPGTEVQLPAQASAVITGRDDDFFEVTFHTAEPLLEYLEAHGRLPLPPYIQREADHTDSERYQTVFATEVGAVAAPTAGLHFDEALLAECRQANIDTAFLTLHVGAGTFQPVRDDDITHHKMHSEHVIVTESLCSRINQCKAQGGRIIAVGTTVVRALESAAQSGQLQPFEGDTRLFLKPGDPFHVIDGLVTNFHLPKSTLLMLVCAFGGYERLLNAYREAVAQRYQFFSYGDAMLVFPQSKSAGSGNEP